jgi:hypothetical protein
LAEGGVEKIEKFVRWDSAEKGDYILLENFLYEDSPLFPEDLYRGLVPIVNIPGSELSPPITIYDLRLQ